jgi:hypothetical protein
MAKKKAPAKKKKTEPTAADRRTAKKNADAETRAKQQADARQPLKQLKLTGDGFPQDPPKDLCQVRDAFLGGMRAAAAAAKEKNKRHDALVEKMQEYGISKIELDGETDYFEIEAVPKVKKKHPPKKAAPKKKADSVGNARK